MVDNSILTVVCTTYNHEKYIEKALKSFVEQKTNYKYKIIVHDDASTDNTKNIIYNFVKNYPSLFIPIFQKENQYSKGIKIYERFIKPLINTKYIAFCEGDDYWVDSNKIQIQIDYLEKHPKCSMCVHNTVMISEDGKNLKKYMSGLNIKERDISTKEIIESCGMPPFHTSSFVFRSSIQYYMPEVFKKLPVGDYPLAIYMSMKGIVHYIPKVMSAYRVMAKGSWTETNNKNKELNYLINCKMIEGLQNIDKYTNYKYTKSFGKIVIAQKYNNLLLEKNYLELFIRYQFLLIFIKRLLPKPVKDFIKHKLDNGIFK